MMHLVHGPPAAGGQQSAPGTGGGHVGWPTDWPKMNVL
jgi:hypothetical protein